MRKATCWFERKQTPGPRLNAPGDYFKNNRFYPAFIRGRCLIGVRRLIEKIRYIILKREKAGALGPLR